ncbi:single-stranded DNA-binding protein [Microbacterium rhizophilus]|uniref:single-stranded DNA-binding protein n=1 Tax=Microbacterium rhizophilus TaxID=3138934 RepID=UPI0031E833EA
MTDIITITGNIATAPEHKALPSGIPVTRFRVASGTRKYDRETSAWVDGPTNWYSVSAYRTLADNAAKSLQKGERVVVTGRLRLRAWESDGRKGMEAEIDADALGHDLLFGTSTFQRSATRAPQAQDDTPPDGSADAWSTPGADAAADEPTPVQDWGSGVSSSADAEPRALRDLATVEAPF